MNLEFRNNELRRLDVNLLLVFLSLLKHRKAADVAIELGLSRSGVSQALRRLRDIFGDELFLRHAHGLEPTAIALALEDPISNAVETLRKAVGEAMVFEPAQAQGTIRIGASDVDQAVLIPELAKHLYHHAPGLKLEVIPCDSAQSIDELKQGGVDLALAESGQVPEKICQKVLFEENWLIVCQPDVLNSAGKINPSVYAQVPHVEVKTQHRSMVKKPAAGNASPTYCVGLTLSGYLPALAVVTRVGGLAIVPMRLAQTFAASFGLSTAPPPYSPPPYNVSALWHARSNNDARLQWVLEQIESVAGKTV